MTRLRIGTGGVAPLYRQIVDQVRALVVSGQLPPGRVAPSVRALAAHFDVSPMTVSKAYGLLAREGVLEHQPGLGMFVPRSRRATALEDRLALMEPSLRGVVDQAARLRLPPALVLERVSELLTVHDGPRQSKNAVGRNGSSHLASRLVSTARRTP